jgi:hypothetical protein
MNFNFKEIRWEPQKAPYTCEGRGCVRVMVYRTSEQMKLDGIKKPVTRNLVYWDYSKDTPVMNKSCIDEVLPLSVVLRIFKEQYGVTPQNHLDYAKKAGTVGILTPESFMQEVDDDYIDPSLVISDNGPSVTIQGR